MWSDHSRLCRDTLSLCNVQIIEQEMAESLFTYSLTVDQGTGCAL